MNIVEELRWRGLIYDMTNKELEDKLINESLTFYIGIDPTADSVHIGTLSSVLVAKRLQLAGHNPIIIAGGGTGLIGDPKPTSERPMISIDDVKHNVECQKEQFKSILDCKIINNFDWLGSLNLVEYLRDFGKFFNINYMINKETVKSRLDAGISYTEFSYMILQSIDFLELYKRENCTLQIGGQDQWGNITAGLELIRKTVGSEVEAYGMTLPLITKSDGTKFGKTESGTIWLDSKRTSPYEMYQFFINTADNDVVNLLKKFTFLGKTEIDELETSLANEPHLRACQKALAKEVVTLVHGSSAYEQAIKITKALFSGKIAELDKNEIELGLSDVPSVKINNDINIVDCLIEAGAASSKREAREFVKNNAVSINGEKVTDVEFIISKENAIDNSITVIRRGKKKYYLVKH